MTANISGPFSGHGHVVVPAQTQGNPRVRETRIAITDDQATRLRAMVDAMQGWRGPAPKPHPVQAPVPPAPPLAPPPVPRTAKVISIASGKGGVGKTTTSVNLAIAMTQLGQRVTLLDADLGMANADVMCGLTPTRRLEHFLGVSDGPRAAGSGPTRAVSELAIHAPGGFRLIPGSVGISRMTELSPPERERLLAALAELDASTDLIIVDTGAGLGREVLSFSRAADLALVVVTPEPTSIADAYALIKCILRREDRARDLRPKVPGGESLPRVGLVVNQATGRAEAEAVHARMSAVCHRFLAYTLPLHGWIVQDARIAASVRRRSPLLVADPGAPAAAGLRTLAGALSTELRLRSVGLPIRPGPGAPEKSRGGLSGLLSRVLRGG